MDHLYVGESLLSFFFSIHWSYKTLFYFCLMDRDLSIVKQFFFLSLERINQEKNCLHIGQRSFCCW